MPTNRKKMTRARKLAQLMMAWHEVALDPIVQAMRIADIDRSVVQRAFEICRTELIPAAVEAEIDAGFARRGRHPTARELRERADANEARLRDFRATLVNRVIDLVRDVLPEVLASNPESPEELERNFGGGWHAERCTDHGHLAADRVCRANCERYEQCWGVVPTIRYRRLGEIQAGGVWPGACLLGRARWSEGCAGRRVPTAP